MPTAHLTKSKSISRKEAKEQQELHELRDSVLGALLGPKPQLPTPQEVLAVGRQEVSAREENFYHDRLAHYAYALHHRPTGARVQFASRPKDAGAAGGDEEAGDGDEEGLLLEYMSVAGRWQEVSLLTDEAGPGVPGGGAGMQLIEERPAAGGAAGPAALAASQARNAPGNSDGGREQDAAEPPPPPLLDQLLAEPDLGATFSSRRRESLAATASSSRVGRRRSLDEGSRLVSGAGCARGLNSNSSSSYHGNRPGLASSGAVLFSASGEGPGAPLPPPLSGPESSAATVSSSINWGMAGAGSQRWPSAAVPRASSLRPTTARPLQGCGASAGSAASQELRRSVDPSPHEDQLAVTTPAATSAAARAGAGARVGTAVARRSSFSLGPVSASQVSLFGGGPSSYGAAGADPSQHPPVCLAGLPAAAFHAAAPHTRAYNSAAGGALATSASFAAAADTSASLMSMRSAWQLADAPSARSLGGGRAGGPALAASARAASPAPPAASASQAGSSMSGLGTRDGPGTGGGVDAGQNGGGLGAAGQAAWAQATGTASTSMAAAAAAPKGAASPLPAQPARLRCVPRTASCTAVIPSGGTSSGVGGSGSGGAATGRDTWSWAREAAAASMQQRQRQEAQGTGGEAEEEDEAYEGAEDGEEEEEEEEEEGQSESAEEELDGPAGSESKATKKKKKRGKGGRLLEEGGKAVESSWRSFSAGMTALRAVAAISVGGIVGRTSMRFGRAAGGPAAGVAGEPAAGLVGAAAAGPAVGPGTVMLSRRQRRASNVILPYPYEHTSALAGACDAAGDGNGNGTPAAAASPTKGSAQAQLAAMLETIRPASPAPPSSTSPVAASKASPPSARGPGRVMRVPSFLSPHPPAAGHPGAPSPAAAGAGAPAAGGLAAAPPARQRNRRASLDETWLAASLQSRAAAAGAATSAATAAGGGGSGVRQFAAAPPPLPPRRGSLEIGRSGASFGVGGAWSQATNSTMSVGAVPPAGAGPTSPAASQSQLSFLKRAAAGGGSPVTSPVTAASTGAGGGVKSPPVASKVGAFDRLVHSLSHALHKSGSKHH
ncbi:hypothetical protein HXX76_000119 [Chlamydomonas incerta]|uniref:Uncharacterized protein n=1 Tax=Chlamydomonas incerta TaxID=51695 RepID=A0A835WDR8_CHLIN|nr:hypothetical protein HXX76_000119 [Chlamydomonas incerta]|eukprot:KAG2445503.1 hypothetical protein HXX76_000119 [Chlamydomonas incerta]